MTAILQSGAPSTWRRLLLWLCLLAFWVSPVWLWAAGGDFDRGLLFRVVPPEGGAASFVFGTIHSEDPRVLALPTPVRMHLDRARAFVLEVVPDADALSESVAAMTYDDGRLLSDMVPDDVYRDSIAALAARGLPEVAVKSFKPWAVMTLLSTPAAKTGQFLDLELYQRAMANGMPVLGLETTDEQLAVFEALSEADQVSLLRDTLTSLPELPAMFQALIDAYLRRDLVALMQLGDTYLASADAELAQRFQAALIDTRNARMVQRMLPMIAQGGHFIAVGALHLPGPGGVLDRLSAVGCDIERLY
jgi:uncharacterized protein